MCYPSIWAGFGLPILEAMAQGTPVVTSRGTSTEEVAGAAAGLSGSLQIGFGALVAPLIGAMLSTTVWPRWDQALSGFISCRWQRLRDRLSGGHESGM